MFPKFIMNGQPSVRCWHNFSHVSPLGTWKPLALRGAAALVLAVAAGFPVGREGPMLCLGATRDVVVFDHEVVEIARPLWSQWFHHHSWWFFWMIWDEVFVLFRCNIDVHKFKKLCNDAMTKNDKIAYQNIMFYSIHPRRSSWVWISTNRPRFWKTSCDMACLKNNINWQLDIKWFKFPTIQLINMFKASVDIQLIPWIP